MRAGCPRSQAISAPLRTLLRDLLVHFNRLVECLPRLDPLLLWPVPTADAPQLINHAQTPLGAAPGRPNRFARDDHIDRVGVHLRELSQGHPAAPLDRYVELHYVEVVVGRDVDAVGNLAVDNQLDSTLVTLRHLTAFGGSERGLGGERNFRRHLDLARFLEIQLTTHRLFADAEVESVGVAVGDVRSALGDSLTPLAEIDHIDLAELHVDAPLADPAARDAREVRFAARLQWEAAVHDVVPADPFGHAGRVHGADKVAHAHRGRDANLLRPDPVHRRDRQVRQLVLDAIDADEQLIRVDLTVAVCVNGVERFRQHAGRGLVSVNDAVLVLVEPGDDAAGGHV